MLTLKCPSTERPRRMISETNIAVLVSSQVIIKWEATSFIISEHTVY
jgi:hypothetical protein